MMTEPVAAAAPASRRWLWLALGLASAIVLATSLPVLWHPQLEPDDYRYLDQLQSLRRGTSSSLVDAFVVENRWDHLWWVETPERIRFFRPLVLLSYALTGASPRGLLATNVLLHWACVLLVGLLLWRWLGPGWPALVGTAGFAALGCHGEVIWYVAGRTDTLAALGVLAGLAAHTSPRRAWRWLGLPCFAFALLAKETGLVLPVLCLLHDLWNGERPRRLGAIVRAEWRLFGAYALVLVGWLALRQAVLGPAGAVFPYFVAPTHPAFLGHLWTQLRSYSENLLLARSTPPFLQLEHLGRFTSWWGLALTTAVLGAVVVLLRRERRFWFFAAAAALAALLTCTVYVSERYLYLPSVAAAGVAGLVVARLQACRRLQLALVVVGLAWAGFQGFMLGAKNLRILGSPRSALVVERQLRAAAAEIPRGAHLLFVNLPGDWLHAQFAAAQARVVLRDPDLTVDVLTVMPWDDLQGARRELRQEGPRALTLQAGRLPHGPASVMMTEQYFSFPWAALDAGRRYSVKGPPGFGVEVLAGQGRRAERLRFTLARPLADSVVCLWTPSAEPGLHWLERRLQSRLQVVAPRPR